MNSVIRGWAFFLGQHSPVDVKAVVKGKAFHWAEFSCGKRTTQRFQARRPF